MVCSSQSLQNHLILNNHRRGFSRWEQFGVNLGSHEGSSTSGAGNEVQPDRGPSKGRLKRTDGHESKGGSDGSASVDETSNGTKRFAASTDRRVRCQIGSDGRGNNIVGSTNNNHMSGNASFITNQRNTRSQNVLLTLQREFPCIPT
jgi:hypothetical protein